MPCFIASWLNLTQCTYCDTWGAPLIRANAEQGQEEEWHTWCSWAVPCWPPGDISGLAALLLLGVEVAEVVGLWVPDVTPKQSLEAVYYRKLAIWAVHSVSSSLAAVMWSSKHSPRVKITLLWRFESALKESTEPVWSTRVEMPS